MFVSLRLSSNHYFVIFLTWHLWKCANSYCVLHFNKMFYVALNLDSLDIEFFSGEREKKSLDLYRI